MKNPKIGVATDRAKKDCKDAQRPPENTQGCMCRRTETNGKGKLVRKRRQQRGRGRKQRRGQNKPRPSAKRPANQRMTGQKKK